MKKAITLYKKGNRLLVLAPYNISELGATYFSVVSGLIMFFYVRWACSELDAPMLWADIKMLAFGIPVAFSLAWYKWACKQGAHNPDAPTRYGKRTFNF